LSVLTSKRSLRGNNSQLMGTEKEKSSIRPSIHIILPQDRGRGSVNDRKSRTVDSTSSLLRLQEKPRKKGVLTGSDWQHTF